MRDKSHYTEGWERVMAVMNHYGLNKNSFSMEIGMSNSMTIGRIINEKRKPIPATLNKIADKCPEINRDWLLTGEGSMLKEESTDVKISQKQPDVVIPADVWLVIKDQAASLKTRDSQMCGGNRAPEGAN